MEKQAADIAASSNPHASSVKQTISGAPLYAVGNRVVAQQRGCHIWRNAVIHDVLQNPNTGEVQYYVHWSDLNKRLDEWVATDRIRALDLKRKRVTDSESGINSPQVATRRRASQTPLTPETPLNSNAVGMDPKTDGRRNNSVSTVKTSILTKKNVTRHPETRFDDKPKNISRVHIGAWTLEPWYFTPYPRLVAELYDDGISPGTMIENRRTSGSDVDASVKPLKANWGRDAFASTLPEIFLCGFCFTMFLSERELRAFHAPRCVRHCPPGNEIYRDIKNKVIMFEVDGAVQRHYCERLCLLARMFLEHKCVAWDTSPFLFYVLCIYDEFGCHFVGYFSKEKNSPDGYNLACILVIPPYQSKGFGRVLIEFSYCLSRIEGKPGTPERPLSDLGLRTYQSYWKDTIADLILMRDAQDEMEISLRQIMEDTAMTLKDIVDTLRLLGVVDKNGSPRLYITSAMRKEHHKRKAYRKIREREMGHVLFDPHLLRWDAFNFELEPISEQQYNEIQTCIGMSTSPHTWAHALPRSCLQ